MARPALFVALLLALVTGHVWGNPDSGLGAEGIRQAELTVFVGGGLGRDDPRKPELFSGDPTRRDAFEASLRDALVERLAKSGVAVSGSESAFAVSIFGRPVDGGNACGAYVVLIEFSITNARYHREIQPVARRLALETPSDERLEQDIQTRVLLILEEELQKARAREE